jgi:HPt (histidine-containing phosphotransfer) domain-containing protein
MNMPAPSDDKDAALQARLDTLRKAFMAKVPEFVTDLRTAVETLETAAGDEAAEARDTVRRQAHRVAGTAATYGLQALADAHKRVERAANGNGDGPDLAEIKSALREIERIVDAGSSD